MTKHENCVHENTAAAVTRCEREAEILAERETQQDRAAWYDQDR